MKLVMKCTFDGLVRALQWKALALREAAEQEKDSDDQRRGSIAEGSVRSPER